MKKTKKNLKAPKTRKSKATKKALPQPTLAGNARAEGLRLFKLAGRPTKQDFVKVYGPNGPKMTWEQRAKAGVDAKHFQEALKAKS